MLLEYTKINEMIILLLFILWGHGVSAQNSTELPNKSVVCNSNLNFVEEIAFVRNEIFARHGRKFQTIKYKDFFSKFSWYNENIKYNDSLLTGKDVRDIKILKSYENEANNLDVRSKAFLKLVLDLIKKFRYSNIDTTIISVGNIDGDSILDTVRTRIYELNNEIIINYTWLSKQKIIWKYDYQNPYMYVDESNLFQYDTRDLWIIFTTAVKHSGFEFKDLDSYKHIDRNIITSIGLSHLMDLGINIRREEYIKYLENFEGQLVYYAQEEIGGNFDIWFEPIKNFVSFYRP